MGLVRPLLSLGRKCVLVMVCVFTLDWSLPLRQAAASSVAKTLSEKIVPTRAPPLRPGGLLSDQGPPLRPGDLLPDQRPPLGPGASSQTRGLVSDQRPPLGPGASSRTIQWWRSPFSWTGAWTSLCCSAGSATTLNPLV